MGFDLTKYFNPNNVTRPNNAPGTIVKTREGFNKRTGAWETHFGTNSGLGISRFDTKSGAVAGRVCYVNMNCSPAEIRQQIIELYYNYHYTQQELAEATGYSQSTISNIINGK